MKNRILFVAVALLTASFVFSCEMKEEKKLEKDTAIVEAVKVPDFNADSAYYFVDKQVSFGPRIPNSEAHIKTGDYIIEALKSFGAEVHVQTFQMRAYDGKMLNLRNIIASFNPESKYRIMLAAHWDTRPFADKDAMNPGKPIDGANDGASGAGVLLEIARTLGNNSEKPKAGIDLVFFDGEDYGQPENSGMAYQNDTWCLGAQYWSKNKHIAGYSANYGILLDMVGAKGAKFAKEENSRRFAPDIVEKVWKTANKLGYSDYFIYADSPGITDDHYYVNTQGGVRMIDIIDFNPVGEDYFPSYHHTQKDNMEIIDKATLKAVGQTMLHVIYTDR